MRWLRCFHTIPIGNPRKSFPYKDASLMRMVDLVNSHSRLSQTHPIYVNHLCHEISFYIFTTKSSKDRMITVVLLVKRQFSMPGKFSSLIRYSKDCYNCSLFLEDKINLSFGSLMKTNWISDLMQNLLYSCLER